METSENPSGNASGRRSTASLLALAALGGTWLLVLLLWVLDITGRELPELLLQAAVLATLAASLTALAGWTVRVARTPEDPARRAVPAAPATTVAEGAGGSQSAGMAGELRQGTEIGLPSQPAPASTWRAAGLALPLLLALSLAVRLVGIDSEVGGRYYQDEGTYYHHATKINDGEVFRRSFIYPHLTYYLDAVALWSAQRFPRAVAALARRVYGVADPLAVSWLLLRAVVALLSAATVVPVYRIAERLAGRGAAVLAGLLLIFSALYNESSHLIICDVPAAFFATVCLALAARLLDREATGDYLAAGIAAGLAAASKYPAGLVAVAIAAVWLRWRIVRRDFRAGLLWAGLAALGSLLAVMPSFFVYPDGAFSSPKSIFFGARQYGGGGWLGVLPASNLGFYAARLDWSFGTAAFAAGLSGLLALAFLDHRAVAGTRGPGGDPINRRRLARLLWLAPFPVAFLTLITSMNMVVKRNLDPVLPILSAFLAVGIVAWGGLLARLARRLGGTSRLSRLPHRTGLPDPPGLTRLTRWTPWIAAAVLALAVVAQPVVLVARQDIGLATPSTREQAAAWIGAHLPPGAAVVKEAYTPDLDRGRFDVSQERFVARIAIADLRAGEDDYVLVASSAFARFQDPDALFKPHQQEFARRYEEIFATFPLAQEWVPDDFQQGPLLRLYRIEPLPGSCLPSATLPASEAFVSDPAMRTTAERPVRFTAPGQWAMVKACLPAGRYRIAVAGAPLPGSLLRVTDAAGTSAGSTVLAPPPGDAPPGPTPVAAGGEAGNKGGEITLPRSAKYFFYLELSPGSRLRQVIVAPASPTPAPGLPQPIDGRDRGRANLPAGR